MWLGLISIATFVLCIIITPVIVIRMSEDHFLAERHASENSFGSQHPVIHYVALILKNLLGLILIAAGIAMLALPGQGLLTIFLGLVVMNFPGKRALEIMFLRLPGILNSLNWIRAKASHPPLKLPPR